MLGDLNKDVIQIEVNDYNSSSILTELECGADFVVRTYHTTNHNDDNTSCKCEWCHGGDCGGKVEETNTYFVFEANEKGVASAQLLKDALEKWITDIKHLNGIR